MVHRLLSDGSIASHRRINPGGMREKKVIMREALNLEGTGEMREVSNLDGIESLNEGGLRMFLASLNLKKKSL